MRDYHGTDVRVVAMITCMQVGMLSSARFGCICCVALGLDLNVG